MVDSLTKLVLVNAIYFKGSWQEKFMVEATKDAPFRLNKVRVDDWQEKFMVEAATGAPFRLNKVRADDCLDDSVLQSHADNDGRSVV